MSLDYTSYVFKRKYGNQIRKLLMLVIADYTGDDTGTAWAFIDTLADRAECSRRSVQEHLDILETQGDLEIYRNAGPKGSHRFRILKNIQPEEQPFKRGAGFAPHPENGGAGFARGVQMGAVKQQERGANERRPFAPKTIEQEKNNKEREKKAPALALEVSDSEIIQVKANINSCQPGWEASPVFSPREDEAFSKNFSALKGITAEAWPILKKYLSAKIPEGMPKFQTNSRERFMESTADILNYAIKWDEFTKPRFAPPKPKEPEPQGEPMKPEEMIAFLREKP